MRSNCSVLYRYFRRVLGFPFDLARESARYYSFYSLDEVGVIFGQPVDSHGLRCLGRGRSLHTTIPIVCVDLQSNEIDGGDVSVSDDFV